MINLSTVDLNKLNSATKYPSILTYHELGEGERLMEKVQVDLSNRSDLYYSEKVDGTNARIIVFPEGRYLIGSREELLHANGDLIFNPSMGIVEALKHTADVVSDIDQSDMVTVYFGEVYGHGIGRNAKNYTATDKVGFRVFDIVWFNPHSLEKFLAEKTIEEISAWREAGLQHFMHEEELYHVAHAAQLELTPRLKAVCPPPFLLSETYEWLKTVLPGNTNAALDGTGGKPEGVVVRTFNRNLIAKIKFRDYQRALGIK